MDLEDAVTEAHAALMRLIPFLVEQDKFDGELANSYVEKFLSIPPIKRVRYLEMTMALSVMASKTIEGYGKSLGLELSVRT